MRSSNSKLPPPKKKKHKKNPTTTTTNNNNNKQTKNPTTFCCIDVDRTALGSLQLKVCTFSAFPGTLSSSSGIPLNRANSEGISIVPTAFLTQGQVSYKMVGHLKVGGGEDGVIVEIIGTDTRNVRRVLIWRDS